MKQIKFGALSVGSRFSMDGQSWLKMGAAEARNTITEEDVFVREDRTVMAR